MLKNTFMKKVREMDRAPENLGVLKLLNSKGTGGESCAEYSATPCGLQARRDPAFRRKASDLWSTQRRQKHPTELLGFVNKSLTHQHRGNPLPYSAARSSYSY